MFIVTAEPKTQRQCDGINEELLDVTAVADIVTNDL